MTEGSVVTVEEERGEGKSEDKKKDDILLGWGWLDMEDSWSHKTVCMKLPLKEI